VPGGGKYVGRRPENGPDNSFTDKQWVDARRPVLGVVNDDASGGTGVRRSLYVAAQANAQAAALVDEDYVKGRDNLRAAKNIGSGVINLTPVNTETSVNTADELLIPLTDKGIPGGVATLDSNTVNPLIPPAQLPTLKTSRLASGVDYSGTPTWTEQDVSSTALKLFPAATLSVPDPGYPYLLLPTARVRGRCTAQTHGPRRTGGGSYGKLAVLTSADAVLAGGISGGQFDWDWTLAVPYAAKTSVPGNNTALNGPATLTLWLSLWSGASFTFSSTGLSFGALVVPAL
jgi:hypothetical protein